MIAFQLYALNKRHVGRKTKEIFLRFHDLNFYRNVSNHHRGITLYSEESLSRVTDLNKSIMQCQDR